MGLYNVGKENKILQPIPICFSIALGQWKSKN
jgi:hypothetical protein